MSNQRTREDEAAWRAWREGVRSGLQCMALMRAIIDAVDACRLRDSVRDKDERTFGAQAYDYRPGL